jgi:hypothetical protein
MALTPSIMVDASIISNIMAGQLVCLQHGMVAHR